MSIKLGTPQPPQFQDPVLVFVGIAAGMAVLLIGVLIVDRVGTAMYRRGYAKPFYIRGRRVHHGSIVFIAPVCYAVITILFFLGYVQIIWNSFLLKFAYAGVLLAIGLAADFLGDRYWPQVRKNAILHHEWAYTIVPAYFFIYVVNVIV